MNYNFQLFEKAYSSISINNSNKKGASGTLTYSNLNIDKESFCNKVDAEYSGRIIEQHYKNLVIFNVYFPNGKVNKKRLNVKIKFYKDFLNYCEELRHSGKSIIICGDFNTAHKEIDLKKTKIYDKSGFTTIEQEHLNKFMKKGYIDTFRYINGDKEESYTWWSYRSKARQKNEGWRIDYILISEDLKDNLSKAYILNQIYGSDHCPIAIELNI